MTRTEQPAQPRSVPVPVGAALQRVATHDADQSAAGHPVGERLVDRVVVQRLGHRGVAVVGGLRPGVRAGIEAHGVRGGVVELLRPVEVVAVEVEGGARQVWHDDRAAGLGAGGVSRREPAAEEQCARHAEVAQLGRSGAQVDRADPPAAERGRPGRQPVVEVGQRVDLDASASAAPHGANLPGARLARGRPPEHHPITPVGHSPDGLTRDRKVHAHDPAERASWRSGSPVRRRGTPDVPGCDVGRTRQ